MVMKTNELLLLTASVTVMHYSGISQTNPNQSDSMTNAKSQMNANMFKLFTGGINTFYTGQQTKGGIDLSVQTYHYYLVTGKTKIQDTLEIANKSLNFADQ